MEFFFGVSKICAPNILYNLINIWVVYNVYLLQKPNLYLMVKITYICGPVLMFLQLTKLHQPIISLNWDILFCLQILPNFCKYSKKYWRTLNRILLFFRNPTPIKDERLNNVIWPTVSSSNFNYLNINSTLTLLVDPKNETYPKWVDLYEKMGVKPFITY